jgi:SAM-dependent methyltransferase
MSKAKKTPKSPVKATAKKWDIKPIDKFRKKSNFNKYLYYENSVQTPHEHVHIFERMFHELRGREALTLKEDFCGTYMISCEWVKSHPKRMAVGVDLDPEPLAYGKANSFAKLKPSEKKRVKILQQDVCIPTKEKFDVIGAGNFSFFIFKERAQMKKYFTAALKSLAPDGIFVIEMAGGPGFIQTSREQKTYTVRGIGKYTYYWDQKSYDPTTNHGIYAIHFKDSKGIMQRDAFVYDWRVWGAPELKDLMIECGFKDASVYWEAMDKNGDGTGEYVKVDKGDNAYAWIAFVVGMR